MFLCLRGLFGSSQIDSLIQSLENKEWRSSKSVVEGFHWILSGDKNRELSYFIYSGNIKLFNGGASLNFTSREKRRILKVVAKLIINGDL